MKTISTTSSNLNNLNEKVSELTNVYNTSRTSENLKELIDNVLELTIFIRRYEFSYSARIPSDFDQDVCLEYIGMILSNRKILDPRHKIRGILGKRIYQHNKTTAYNLPGTDFLIDTTSSINIGNKLLLSDIVKTELEGVSDRLCCLILFYVVNFKLLKNFIVHYPNILDKYVVALKVYEIRKKVMDEGERNFDITFSKNRISNLLMLSGLFNENPAMFVLLTLFGDFKKFLTFISLFENKEIQIPKISEINNIFSKSSVISNNFGQDSLSINDKENLLSLVMNVNLEDANPDTKLNKFMDEYLAELVMSSVEKHSKIEEKQFKYLDFTNTKKVREAYSIVNEELITYNRLLKEIVSTVSTIKEINSAIELMQSNKTTNE